MSQEPDDLAAAVAALQTEVADLRTHLQRVAKDAAAAQVLARGADRDVADLTSELRDFRTHNTNLHNATREDLRETRQELRELRESTNAGFMEMRGKLDATAAGQAQIAELLTTLIERGDRNDAAD
ncbi:hypothetical protein BAY61_28660 [Prauserella marina]|uniref:Uncharacterized protein n=1 Tax=Prauserella marina TaxID=530584 RepID=A0A222VWK8_9PSEU|nr:hypothetical protein [Prauserella marina]ASR38319.1 hypothetical protein BAY61_28660 [Prauserella marina]PWV78470.1 hypothetical protein DES30_104205 [Prauserella marina]SDC86723.1 hypothetical protein SAMN05421630_104205 [Prauserella marina]